MGDGGFGIQRKSAGSASAAVALFVPTGILLSANLVVSVDGFGSALRNHRRGYRDVFPEVAKVWPALFKNVAANGKSTCAICLEDFDASNSVVNLPCDHVFHADYIAGWFQRDLSCPMRCAKVFVQLASSRVSPHVEALGVHVLPWERSAVPVIVVAG